MRSFFGAGAPPMLRVATAAQGLEAAGLAVAAVIAAVGTATGQSSKVSNGVDLALLEFIVAAGLALIATGLARVRPWSRTPAVMAQLICAVIGITALQGGQVAWGVPAVLLALVGLAGLLTPASLRALNRPAPAVGEASPKQASPKPPVPPAAKAKAKLSSPGGTEHGGATRPPSPPARTPRGLSDEKANVSDRLSAGSRKTSRRA